MITIDHIKELEKEMLNVPFGNSAFQNQNFGVQHNSDARKYRHCLLQIDQKLRALKTCEFRRRRLEIDLEEIKYKLNTEDLSTFDRRRLEIDFEEKEYGLNTEIKLIEDALIELHTYDVMLSKLPKITREEFENSEQKYWTTRLLESARHEIVSNGTVSVGILESLEQIGLKVGRNDGAQIIYQSEPINNLITEE